MEKEVPLHAGAGIQLEHQHIGMLEIIDGLFRWHDCIRQELEDVFFRTAFFE